ncbi:MAG TPA: hypothetical protein VFR24_18025 [Candidatus Angelobacter sp.]|nr:hypothetical protein [Candidatus Angelobacter sp.]
MKQRVFLQITAVAVMLFACAAVASAQSAGYDLFQTGSGTSVDLTSMGVGVVQLQGNSISGAPGNTDTLIQRTQDVPAGGGNVPIAVYALSMKSSSSVTFQGQQADVYVTINNTGGTISTSTLPQPDSLSASSGSLTVRTDGTFDSSLTVNADIIFVKAGASVTDDQLARSFGGAFDDTFFNQLQLVHNATLGIPFLHKLSLRRLLSHCCGRRGAQHTEPRARRCAGRAESEGVLQSTGTCYAHGFGFYNDRHEEGRNERQAVSFFGSHDHLPRVMALS